MNLDPYPTLKRSLTSLREYSSPFVKEVVTTDKHDLWSTKKLIALLYYIRPYVQIMRKNNFKKLHYVDLFAGSGLLKIMGKIMPGTPLITLLRTKDLVKKKKNLYFDEIHLSDNNAHYMESLQTRTLKLSTGIPSKIELNNREFAPSVDKIFTGINPKFENSKDDCYLVVLDPYGFQVDWSHLEKILKSGAVDLFLTFPTSNINWNQHMKQSHKSLTLMFGNEKWMTCKNADDYVNLYCEKIKKIPTKWLPFKTKTLNVSTKTGKYHLICASRSPGADKIFSDMQARFDGVNNKLLKDVFEVAVKGQPDLDSFS